MTFQPGVPRPGGDGGRLARSGQVRAGARRESGRRWASGWPGRTSPPGSRRWAEPGPPDPVEHPQLVADGDRTGLHDQHADAEVGLPLGVDRAQHVEVALDATGLGAGGDHAAVDRLDDVGDGGPDLDAEPDEALLAVDAAGLDRTWPRKRRRSQPPIVPVPTIDTRSGPVVERLRGAVPLEPGGIRPVLEVGGDLEAPGTSPPAWRSSMSRPSHADSAASRVNGPAGNGSPRHRRRGGPTRTAARAPAGRHASPVPRSTSAH